MAKNKYFKIGSVLKSKENEKEYYLKLSTDAAFTVKNKDGEVVEVIEMEAGQSLNLQTPQAEIAFLVENNHISEADGEERLEKIPDFVKYNVKAKVVQEDKPSKKNTPSKKSRKDDDF